MANTNHNVKKWALAGLFKRINLGEDPKLLCNEARQLARNINPSDIAGAEQALINEGYPCRLVRQISSTFSLMRLLKKEHNNSASGIPYDHILRKITVEHDLARCFLADLNNVAETIWGLNGLTDVSSEFRNLANILGHFRVMKEHVEREEDIIFPYLKKFGWIGLCRAAETEHANIRMDIHDLIVLIRTFNEIRFEAFKAQLITIVQRLSSTMLEHLSYEDNLLWPISLVVIDDVKIWESIKALCDEIGYCNARV
ncbi:MAG: hemerythrin domain-containing protein [Planctomycetota bacterium]|jgi:DUF438 domain-containing protein